MKPIVSIGNQDPVIFLSFAAVKGDTYAEVREGIIQILKLPWKICWKENVLQRQSTKKLYLTS